MVDGPERLNARGEAACGCLDCSSGRSRPARGSRRCGRTTSPNPRRASSSSCTVPGRLKSRRSRIRPRTGCRRAPQCGLAGHIEFDAHLHLATHPPQTGNTWPTKTCPWHCCRGTPRRPLPRQLAPACRAEPRAPAAPAKCGSSFCTSGWEVGGVVDAILGDGIDLHIVRREFDSNGLDIGQLRPPRCTVCRRPSSSRGAPRRCRPRAPCRSGGRSWLARPRGRGVATGRPGWRRPNATLLCRVDCRGRRCPERQVCDQHVDVSSVGGSVDLRQVRLTCQNCGPCSANTWQRAGPMNSDAWVTRTRFPTSALCIGGPKIRGSSSWQLQPADFRIARAASRPLAPLTPPPPCTPPPHRKSPSTGVR